MAVRRLSLSLCAVLGAVVIAACDRGGAEVARAAVPDPIDVGVTAAARDDSIERARQDSINRGRPDYIVDSILPIDEQLRRFRGGLPELRQLTRGATSREALVDSITASLARSDTAALRRLTMSRAEFAWLVYPSSPFVDGAMRQAPQVAWLLLANASATGFARVLDRLGGTPNAIRDVDCEPTAVVEGANRITSDCVVRWHDREGRERAGRLWGALIERDGRWKVMNWANDF